ncbi:helix-turn-helix domain-containing protein [Kaistella palustris]|uniref:helix-turn-helix domain-containing protein n=1 Tax=Kaistella palustris TaxID=493376 RepID=UPI0004873C9F|nr:helix-turn-helix transcriptional regulator [Kaistella palustris]
MSLNDRISKVIAYSGLTSSEFADEIDVQRSNISHITSGRNKPSLDFIIKIKERFPDLDWDWLITGKGEMLQKKADEPVVEKTPRPSLPDLFSLIDDQNFGITESEDTIKSETPRESNIPGASAKREKISDSQRLETEKDSQPAQAVANQEVKVKRIVLFFDNGKFETFEP